VQCSPLSGVLLIILSVSIPLLSVTDGA